MVPFVLRWSYRPSKRAVSVRQTMTRPSLVPAYTELPHGENMAARGRYESLVRFVEAGWTTSELLFEGNVGMPRKVVVTRKIRVSRALRLWLDW